MRIVDKKEWEVYAKLERKNENSILLELPLSPSTTNIEKYEYYTDKIFKLFNDVVVIEIYDSTLNKLAVFQKNK